MTINISYKESAHSVKEKRDSIQLVKESFGDVDMAYEDYYDWQFLQNPVGKGTILFAYDGDLPVGQVASIPCKYLMPGKEPVTVTLTMNVCVSPRYRGMGILTELMTRIHKVGQYSVPFSIGIPNDQSMKGHLKNKYQRLPMTLLIRPVILSDYFSNSVIRKLARPFDILWRKGTDIEYQVYSERFDERFNDLTNVHQKSIRQLRNSDLLNWRYIDNPRRKYKVFAAIDDYGEQVQGYLVARVVEVFGVKLGLVVDFVARNETQHVKNLVLNALRYFWENKVTFAAAVCFTSCIEYRLLRNGGFFLCPKRFRPHPLTLCVRLLDEVGYKENMLLNPNNWFFMFGDYETF